MRSLHLLLVVWLGTGSLFAQQAAAPPPADPKPEPEVTVEEIITKVNGQIITRADLERDLVQMETELKRQQRPEEEIRKLLADSKPNLLREKIDHYLLVNRAEQLDIKVDADVNKQISRIMLDYKIADQDKLAELVRQQAGMRLEDFKEDMKNQLLKQRVMGAEVGSRIFIPRTEIEKYYNEHKAEFERQERVYLQEILISAEKIGEEEAKKKADEVAERAKAGVKFEDLAREHSAAETKDTGGYTPAFQKADLRAELVALVWDKDKFYVTDPYRLANGSYLILRVVEHHQAGVAAIEEVESEIQNRLMEPQFGPKAREYLTGLRKDAFLEIKEGWVDTGAAPGKDTSWTEPEELVPETIEREAVIANPGHKRLLWMVPIPGSARAPTSTSR